MLLPLSNLPRNYDWGSTTLIADFEGREPSGAPEAEIWFGDHPGSPALTADGRTLDVWLREESADSDAPDRLPYLLKVLAAGSPLSIQAHPSKAQAVEGFAREEAAGIPRDAPHRTYRDDNHKPELIVAISDTFTALAGLRGLDDTRRLLTTLGAAGDSLAARLSGPDAAASLRESLAWLLSGAASDDIAGIVGAAAVAESAEFAAELALVGRLDAAYPGDPGVAVALLMNVVALRRGEAIFVPAGVLHAYLEGLGVEIMAASDNVLRGGLTPKHIDVDELMSVLDTTPGPVPILRPTATHGVSRFTPPVSDFALTRIVVNEEQTAGVRVDGLAIVLATEGSVAVSGGVAQTPVALTPGRAVLVTPDELSVSIDGDGEVFITQPGVS